MGLLNLRSNRQIDYQIVFRKIKNLNEVQVESNTQVLFFVKLNFFHFK